MSDEPTDGVMGSLPRTRPHRRSAKRGPAAEPASPPTGDRQPSRATPAAKGKATAAAKKATATGKGKATAATGKGTAGKGKGTAANGKATAASSAARTAKAKSPGGSASSGDTLVRSLQSATAPRAASDRSRKPGATSQAHHKAAARPARPLVARPSAPPAAEPAGAVGTAVQAAAELTEIGLKAGARALRGALARLPRP